jgi:hypothetical protein
MKKLMALALAAALLCGTGFAQGLTEKEAIDAKIAKIEKEIERLEGRLAQVKSEEKIYQILSMIDDHEENLAKLTKKLEELEKPIVEEKEEVPEAPEEVIVQPELVPEREEEKKPVQRFEFQIGGMAGLFAGATGAFGETRFHLPYVIGPATSSLRLAGGLCQSDDMSKRFAPVQIDMILDFPAGWFTGVANYLGAGLNYVVRMTGQTAGAIGGEVFYGVESRGFGGTMFGEMGYGMLRSGLGTSHKGITVMVGYRRDWGF